MRKRFKKECLKKRECIIKKKEGIIKKKRLLKKGKRMSALILIKCKHYLNVFFLPFNNLSATFLIKLAVIFTVKYNMFGLIGLTFGIMLDSYNYAMRTCK